MPFSIEDKLVIAVSSSALFDLSEPDKVFRNHDFRQIRTGKRCERSLM